MKRTIKQSGNCFDEAQIIALFLIEQGANVRDIIVVHGRVSVKEKKDYAHCWVEHKRYFYELAYDVKSTNPDEFLVVQRTRQEYFKEYEIHEHRKYPFTRIIKVSQRCPNLTTGPYWWKFFIRCRNTRRLLSEKMGSDTLLEGDALEAAWKLHPMTNRLPVDLGQKDRFRRKMMANPMYKDLVLNRRAK